MGIIRIGYQFEVVKKQVIVANVVLIKKISMTLNWMHGPAIVLLLFLQTIIKEMLRWDNTTHSKQYKG